MMVRYTAALVFMSLPLVLAIRSSASAPAPFEEIAAEMAGYGTLFAVVEWGQATSLGPAHAWVIRSDHNEVVLDRVDGRERLHWDGIVLTSLTPNGEALLPWGPSFGEVFAEIRSGFAGSTWTDHPAMDWAGLSAWQGAEWAKVEGAWYDGSVYLSTDGERLTSVLATTPEGSVVAHLAGSSAHLKVRYLRTDVLLAADWNTVVAKPILPPLPAEVAKRYGRRGHPTPEHHPPSEARFVLDAELSNADHPPGAQSLTGPAICSGSEMNFDAPLYRWIPDLTDPAWIRAQAAQQQGCTLTVEVRASVSSLGTEQSTVCGEGHATVELLQGQVLGSAGDGSCAAPIEAPDQRITRLATVSLVQPIQPDHPVGDLVTHYVGSQSTICQGLATTPSSAMTYADPPALSWTCP